MASFKLFGAALIWSTAFATPVFAQIPLPGDYSSEPVYASEPGLAAFYHPNGNLRIGASGPANQMTVFARVVVPPEVRQTRPRRAHR